MKARDVTIQARATPDRKPDDLPDAVERTRIARRLREMGVPPNEVAKMVLAGWTRKRTIDDLMAWLQTRPKG